MDNMTGLISLTIDGRTTLKIHTPDGGDKLHPLVEALLRKFPTEESLKVLTSCLGTVDVGRPIPLLADMFIESGLPDVQNAVFQFSPPSGSVYFTLGHYDTHERLGYELTPSKRDAMFNKSWLSPIYTNLVPNGMASYTYEIRMSENNPTIVIEHKSEILY